MSSKIQIFILSLKNSDRIDRLKKRLKILNINYRILLGINGSNKTNNKKLKKVYNKKKTISFISRELAFPEIAASYAHLKAYEIIVKKKIMSAIIMEDDVYPSKMMSHWVKNNIKIDDNYILSFYVYPGLGFIYKKPKIENILNTNKNKINTHDAKTHLLNGSCYQINYQTCKKILKITNRKVCGFVDWPINLQNNKINLGVTLPYLNTFMKNKSNTAAAREKMTPNIFHFKFKLPIIILNILKTFYYLSLIPYFFGRYNNFNFYYEYFLFKHLQLIKNNFLSNYYNTEKIYNNKKFYSSDLRNKIN
jgi:GR25 family glycosyltransferase involved in LPS biosynthesis